MPDRILCSVVGGYGSPSTFRVSTTNTDNQWLSCLESICSRRSSGHFSIPSWLFLYLRQPLKFLRAHPVASSVFLGTKGLDNLASSTSLTIEKRLDSSLDLFFSVGMGSSWLGSLVGGRFLGCSGPGSLATGFLGPGSFSGGQGSIVAAATAVGEELESWAESKVERSL